MGISSQCNSNQNGTAMASSASVGHGFTVADADHCDFESPTNAICTTFCSNNSAKRSDGEIQDVIKTMSTAWLSWHAGLETEASRWWDSSDEVMDNYLGDGDLSEL